VGGGEVWRLWASLVIARIPPDKKTPRSRGGEGDVTGSPLLKSGAVIEIKEEDKYVLPSKFEFVCGGGGSRGKRGSGVVLHGGYDQ